MRKLIYEEPIVPVYIDREQELQAYYQCADSLFQGCHGSNPNYNPAAPYPSQGPGQPQGAWGGQGYAYPTPPPSSYPYAQQYDPSQYPSNPSPYPAYAGNPAYPGYPPQNPGYAPTQPNFYPPAQPAPQYDPYGQVNPYPAAQYPGYGQAPAPYPPQGQYQPGYAPYQGYPQPQAAAPGYYPQQQPQQQYGQGQAKPTKAKELSASAPSGDEFNKQKPAPTQTFGWDETLFGDFGYDSYYSRPPVSTPSYYAGRNVVDETVTTSQSSRTDVNDYYSKQFERLTIGWNV